MPHFKPIYTQPHFKLLTQPRFKQLFLTCLRPLLWLHCVTITTALHF